MKVKPESKKVYTDEDINELADWLENLSLRETFFIKETYEMFLKEKQSLLEENLSVH